MGSHSTSLLTFRRLRSQLRSLSKSFDQNLDFVEIFWNRLTSTKPSWIAHVTNSVILNETLALFILHANEGKLSVRFLSLVFQVFNLVYYC